MKCGHGNSPDKCIYPKCLENRGKERPSDEGVTDFSKCPECGLVTTCEKCQRILWDDTKGNVREFTVPKGTTL